MPAECWSERDPTKLAEQRDLDDVVEPERKNGAARRGSSARGQAAGAVGPLTAGEDALPTERTEAEAREIGASNEEDQGGVRALQGPAGVA